VPRSEPITRLEVASCPTHRKDVRHYAEFEVGCACLDDARRGRLETRLDEARSQDDPLAEMAE
jgi:hypothetical protein